MSLVHQTKHDNYIGRGRGKKSKTVTFIKCCSVTTACRMQMGKNIMPNINKTKNCRCKMKKLIYLFCNKMIRLVLE